VIELAPERIAAEAGMEVLRAGSQDRPARAVIDSRGIEPGDLFFGLVGESVDGGEFAGGALEAGAWGAVARPEHARPLAAEGSPGWVLATADPLSSLQRLARAWRRELGCPTVGITGSTGKTSVKDITRALLPLRAHASPENYNTEIGLPLTVLAAPPETEVLVLEMAMRGRGQIAELCAIAEPDVAAITNVGPVHLELLGTVEAIAETKAEILAGLGVEGTAVVPADADALAPHIEERLRTITFGPGGDVSARQVRVREGRASALVETPAGEVGFEFPFTEAHNVRNALCAIAIGLALGADLAQMARRAPGITFSRLRGELVGLAGGIVLVNDSYNANPISMRAALDHLAGGVGGAAGAGRKLAVLGEMKELGPETRAYHREIGAYARGLGVAPVVGVGGLAREYGPDEWVPDAAGAVDAVDALLEPGDAVLVKGSRSVGLELVADELRARRGEGSPRQGPTAGI
jgi:UDP-N-acetylmuramoyl-tripeptide--D-alanyl-D-alanine ligase